MPRKGFSFGKKKRHSKVRGRHSYSATANSSAVLAEPSLQEQSADEFVNQAEPSELDTSRAEMKFSAYPTSASVASTDYYGFFHSSFFTAVFDCVLCPSCQTASLHLDFTSNKGFAAFYKLFCSVCDSVIWSGSSSPVNGSRHDINQRAVLASKETGISHAKLSCLLALMNVSAGMHQKSYQEISNEVHHAAVFAAESSMNRAAEVIRERAQTTAIRKSSTGCPVVTVSFDGTRHKRGHSSHSGVGVAIDFDTGLVVETQVISNFCVGCARGPIPDSERYAEWHAKHSYMCMKNFEGSSNAMEAEAAKLVFSRSVRKRGLVYGTMLCDGDSKAFNTAKAAAGYDIPIEKEDCINPISKRMWYALDTLKKSNRSECNRKLTQPNIDKVTNVYAKSLKDNAPDVNKMKLGVLGSFLHMSSTDESPNHRHCPKGPTSWCHYQRSLATGTPFRPHTPTIHSDLISLVYPTIKRLSDPEILARCAKMGTQNANESFNALIWRQCPKTEFCNRWSVETATCLAILGFNNGKSGIRMVMEEMGIPWTTTIKKFCEEIQQYQIRNAKRKVKGLSKWKRKNAKRRRIIADHENQQKEGKTYEGGGFNN